MESKRKVKAILVDIIHPRMLPEHALERMGELEELVRTYGGIVIVKTYQRRFEPHPRTFIGPGKVADMMEEGKKFGVELIIVNDQLKPRQMYNVMEILKGNPSTGSGPSGIQCWDRLDLILKIFGKHAKTTEARLEIELASIRHMGPRIYGMGMELSRQGGGIGTSGIGETNTERMKRHLQEQELKIKERIERYERVRGQHRQNRTRNGFKTAAIVGYTNAGKTTLLNALTGRKEYAANELFATLDTRVGEWYLPTIGKSVLLSDTIGFIKNLPPELIKAFASTLSEAVEANILLHAVDASDEHAAAHIRVVEEILGRLGIMGSPRIIVFTKSEDVTKAARKRLKSLVGELPCVFVSSITREGLEALGEELIHTLQQAPPKP